MPTKTYLVAQREFLENLRTKAFWIGILVFPIILTMAVVIPMVLEMTRAPRKYAVIDHSGWLGEVIERQVAVSDLERVLSAALVRHDAGRQQKQEPNEPLRNAVEVVAQLRDEMAPASPATDAPVAPAGPAAEAAGADAPGAAGQSTEPARGEAAHRLIRTLAEAAAPDAPAGSTPEPVPAAGGLSPANEQRLLAEAEPLRAWWSTVSPRQAEALARDLGRSRAIKVDVDLKGDALEAELRRRVAAEELFAYFVIPAEPLALEPAPPTDADPDRAAPARVPAVTTSSGFRYIASNLTDEELRDWFKRTAAEVLRQQGLAASGVDPELARWIQDPLELEVQKVARTGDVSDVGAEDMIRQWAPVAFVYLLWLAVFSIAQMLLTNTIEEKSNRIMEVLLSSVSPLQLMVGKILGIAATGLTVVSSWMLFFWGGVSLVPMLLGLDPSRAIGIDLGRIASDPFYVGGFLVYFLLGYLFYASLLVGIGAVCSSLKEAQNLMTPITILLMVPLLSMMPIGKDPNGLLARIMSFIPPFTPFVMMNRAAGPPSPLEYLLTTVLMVLSIVLVMWASAKVFRIGILMTGKPPRLGEILRWLRAPVGTVPARRTAEADEPAE